MNTSCASASTRCAAARRSTPATGQPLGGVAEFHDLTERRRDEALLKASTAELEDLHNNAPCGYHSVDCEGRFLGMNDTELRWLGYTCAEIVGRKRIADLAACLQPERMPNSFARFLDEGHLRDHEVALRRRDGSIRPVIISATAILDANGKVVASCSTVYDMTRFKQDESRNQYMNQLLEQRNAELADAVAELLNLSKVARGVLAGLGQLNPRTVTTSFQAGIRSGVPGYQQRPARRWRRAQQDQNRNV